MTHLVGEVIAELDHTEFSGISDYVKHQVIRELVARNKELEEELSTLSSKNSQERPDDTPLGAT
jgi:hypothetical protein